MRLKLKLITSMLPTTGAYLIQLRNHRLLRLKKTLWVMGLSPRLSLFCRILPSGHAASAPATGRMGPLCPEAAFVLLFPNFKLPADLFLSVTATQAALFFPFPPGAPQLFPQPTPPHLFISTQGLPGHSVYRHILGFPLSHFTLDYLPVT